MNSVIIRINGIRMLPEMPMKNVSQYDVKCAWNPPSKTVKVAAINTWIVASTLLTTAKSHAASTLSSAPSIWSEMLPVFHVFQDISMVLGALAILSGLIIMIFKKSLGWTVVNTSIAVVLGCFLVPAAVMLLAIVGDLLNGSLQKAFEAFHAVKR